MKRISDYSEISEAVARHFGRTTVTNCFIDREIYEREIKAGTLYTVENDDGLYIFRQRDGFSVMYFYLDSPDASVPDFEGCTVTEVPYRERDEGLKAISARMQENGLEKAFTRVRLQNVAEPFEFSNDKISAATVYDTEEALRLIRKSFDNRTGCIPTVDAFRADIENGHVLVYRDGGIKGLVHFNVDKASSTIRHVAVEESCRGEGIASLLVRAYLSDKKGRCRVWAREDYNAARRVYEKNGYMPDGMKSDVLIKN